MLFLWRSSFDISFYIGSKTAESARWKKYFFLPFILDLKPGMDRRFEGLRLGQPWVKVKKILNTLWPALATGPWETERFVIQEKWLMTRHQSQESSRKMGNINRLLNKNLLHINHTTNVKRELGDSEWLRLNYLNFKIRAQKLENRDSLPGNIYILFTFSDPPWDEWDDV